MMRGARHDGRRKFGVTRDAENGGGALLDHLQFHASRKLVKKQMNKLDAVHQFIQAQALLATSIIFFSPGASSHPILHKHAWATKLLSTILSP
eukprot:scaffold185386_cov15-Tisochrysis_lutea.AAC.1